MMVIFFQYCIWAAILTQGPLFAPHWPRWFSILLALILAEFFYVLGVLSMYQFTHIMILACNLATTMLLILQVYSKRAFILKI